MQKKLTVTINEAVYEGLRTVIGPRKISRFIEALVRPHVLKKQERYPFPEKIAADQIREPEAFEWAEGATEELPINLKHLSREKKWRVMEALWEDLSNDEGALASPDWHKEALLETERRFNSNQETILDWQEAKKDLRKRFE